MSFRLLSGALLLLAHLVLIQSPAIAFDPSISNGTCYYKPDGESDPLYAPAGNVALGHQFCCQLGDKINSDNACYDDSVKYTYLAGCTDPTYEDVSCPNKGNYSDYQWVGLVHDDDCMGTGIWVGCVNDGNPTVRISDESSNCHCNLTGDDPDVALFTHSGTNGLDAIGWLPKTKGGSINYYPGMSSASTVAGSLISAGSLKSTEEPTSTKTRDFTTESAPISAVSNTMSSYQSSADTASVTSTTSPGAATGEPVPRQSITRGAAAGIALGTIFGSLVLVGLAIYFGKRWKQSHRKKLSIDLVEPDTSQPPDCLTGSGQDDVVHQSPTYPVSKLELPGSPPEATRHGSNSASCTPDPNNRLFSPTSIQREPGSRTFRYQSNTVMEDIRELPDDQRPQWAKTGFGTYGPDRGWNQEKEVERGSNQVHELPG